MTAQLNFSPERGANAPGHQPGGELIHLSDFDPRQSGGDFSTPGALGKLAAVGELTWVRETPFEDASGKRIRKTGFIDINGHEHLVRSSEPQADFVEDPTAVVTNVLMPGLTEAADVGTASMLHGRVAERNPGERTVTIATDGHSVHGQSLPYRQAFIRPFRGSAAARHAITGEIAGDGPVKYTGTSMGSVLTIMTAQRNLQAHPSQQLNIQGLDLLSPGIIASKIDNREEFPDGHDSLAHRAATFLGFLGHVTADSVREGFRHPDEALEAALGAARIGKAIIEDPSKGVAILGNIIQLAEGTPWPMLKEVIQEYPVRVLTGSLDPLAQVDMWHALQAMYPNHVDLNVLDGKGHALLIGAKDTAGELAKGRLELLLDVFDQVAELGS